MALDAVNCHILPPLHGLTIQDIKTPLPDLSGVSYASIDDDGTARRLLVHLPQQGL